ncbi:hypothetical protein EYF80_032444 [Liparis tanakae]|uniref:Uncharacterized protein n=1 Tax=Liparis tanakae TaxID=230148 RepID=A0A4Z2GUZ5_9TELE|nr:hypothetical protein EYF80_032444 [Liparis tanakae]
MWAIKGAPGFCGGTLGRHSGHKLQRVVHQVYRSVGARALHFVCVRAPLAEEDRTSCAGVLLHPGDERQNTRRRFERKERRCLSAPHTTQRFSRRGASGHRIKSELIRPVTGDLSLNRSGQL